MPWWDDVDPKDREIAREVVPWGTNPDQMVVLENTPRMIIQTPKGAAACLLDERHEGSPRPLWTLFVDMVRSVRAAMAFAYWGRVLVLVALVSLSMYSVTTSQPLLSAR